MADESRGRMFAVSFRHDAHLSFVILQFLSVINNNVAPRPFNVLKLTILAAYMKYLFDCLGAVIALNGGYNLLDIVFF